MKTTNFPFTEPQMQIINLGLMVEHNEVKDYLQENKEELKDGLSKLGFQISHIQVKQTQIPSTLQPETQNPLHTNLSGIDVKI